MIIRANRLIFLNLKKVGLIAMLHVVEGFIRRKDFVFTDIVIWLDVAGLTSRKNRVSTSVLKEYVIKIKCVNVPKK